MQQYDRKPLQHNGLAKSLLGGCLCPTEMVQFPKLLVTWSLRTREYIGP